MVSKSGQIYVSTYPLIDVTRWTIVIAEIIVLNALIFPLIFKYLAWSNLDNTKALSFFATSALIQLVIQSKPKNFPGNS